MEDKIKAGETYNVRVKVIGITKNGVDAIYVDDEGIAGLHIGKRRVGILRPISPENGIKNTESASKYDPCRMFKKGDRVEVVKYKGRNGSMDTPVATLAVVIDDEGETPQNLSGAGPRPRNVVLPHGGRQNTGALYRSRVTANQAARYRAACVFPAQRRRRPFMGGSQEGLLQPRQNTRARG